MAQAIVSGLSPRKPGFEPTPFYVKFVVSVYLDFFPVSLQQRFISLLSFLDMTKFQLGCKNKTT